MADDDLMAPSARRETLGFLWFFLSTYPLRTLGMVVLLAVAGLAEGVGVLSILPVLEVAGGGGGAESTIGQIVTGAVNALGLPSTVPVLLGVIVAAMTAKAVFTWFAMRTVGFTTADVTADLRLKLLDAVLNARWQAFADRSAGELANALGSEAQRSSGAFRQASTMLSNIIIVAVYAVASFLVSWRATIFAVIAGVVFLTIFNRLVALSRSAGRKQTRLLKSLTSRFVDALSGLKAVKAMALERHIFPFLRQSVEKFSDAEKEQVTASETQRVFKEPVLTLFLAGGIAGLMALGETISKVLVLAFIAYRLLGILGNVQGTLQAVVGGESAFWSLQDLLQTLEDQAEVDAGTRPPPALENGIRFDDVHFNYGEGPVLSGLNLFIPTGRFVALTGESGTGKTTIADLIIGLHSPTGGCIYIDDVPLSDIPLPAWRSMIGYVPQEPILFNDTVLTNLTLGDNSFSRTEVEAALDSAGALDFVMRKPEGLDTMVGEKGAKLSGGQRQRIAVARALLRHPDLLILDEPTTALDPETEEKICQTLSGLGGDLTILAISHQSAIRRVADVVLNLEDGTVSTYEDKGLSVAATDA